MTVPMPVCQMSISCLEADAFVSLGSWACIGTLSYGSNLLFCSQIWMVKQQLVRDLVRLLMTL